MGPESVRFPPSPHHRDAALLTVCSHWQKICTSLWASLLAQRVKICLQRSRPGFHLRVRKVPWRRKWQPTPVLLPGECHGQRSLAGYSPWGHEESDTTESHTHTLPLSPPFLPLSQQRSVKRGFYWEILHPMYSLSPFKAY